MEERPERDTVSWGIMNADGILIAYGEYHDEMASIFKGAVLHRIEPKQMSAELEKASKYYMER